MSETEWVCDDCYENPCECPTASQETAMGGNVERLRKTLDEVLRAESAREARNAAKDMYAMALEMIEADREEGIEVELFEGELMGLVGDDGALIVAGDRLFDLTGPYTLIKREAGDSEEEA